MLIHSFLSLLSFLFLYQKKSSGGFKFHTLDYTLSSNAEGLVNAKGEVVTTCEEGIETVGEYIVHPAFSRNAQVGGGWTTSSGENIEGIWVGKFETTGSSSNVTVKPGESSLRSRTINNQYKAGKSATFGETSSEVIGSHMAKNSEWGAVAYLSHSSYGLDGAEIEQNTERYITGGSSTKSEIYTTNAGQSTTGNAYGVYDMSGGASENVANYANYSGGSFSNGGNTEEDLYNASNPEESTKYKTVYGASETHVAISYNLAAGKKEDGIYEMSKFYSGSNAWFNAESSFPMLE